MSATFVWYKTELPPELVDLIKREVKNHLNLNKIDSELQGGKVVESVRNSENSWLETTNWVAGFLWYYIARANRENFLYDIEHIDGESIQVTSYAEGQYYNWHIDAGLSNCHKPQGMYQREQKPDEDFIAENKEVIRKLSFSLQLSDVDEYEGGQVQFMDDASKTYFAPKTKGTLIIFDSRTRHRVLKVTKGRRLSLVGWVVGPRWR